MKTFPFEVTAGADLVSCNDFSSFFFPISITPDNICASLNIAEKIPSECNAFKNDNGDQKRYQ